jgi:hypothetical protein
MISNKDINRITEETWAAVRKLRSAKAAEYSTDTDALDNFKRCAFQSGCSIEHILMLFAMKHWNSIVDYIKDIDAGRTRERTESIDGRINDLIVYLILFKGMIEARACQVTETSANSFAAISPISTGSALRQVPRAAE